MTQQSTPKVGFFGALSEFRKWAVLILLALVLFFGYKFFTTKSETSSIEYDTNLIQQQIKNVGKLVVTEGHFAEVLTYKDKKETYIPGLSFDKKALVVINADVTVGFDLSKVKYDIDAKNKTVTIVSIPGEEIKNRRERKENNRESATVKVCTGDTYK